MSEPSLTMISVYRPTCLHPRPGLVCGYKHWPRDVAVLTDSRAAHGWTQREVSGVPGRRPPMAHCVWAAPPPTVGDTAPLADNFGARRVA